MAPPLINLPSVAGSISLAFTTSAAAPEVQRPGKVASEPAEPEEPGEPTPPALPDPTPPELPDPVGAEAPESEPTTDAPLMPAEETPPAAAPRSPSSQPVDPMVEVSPGSERESAPPLRPADRLLRPRKTRFFFNVLAGGRGAIRGVTGYYGGGSDLMVEEAIGGHTRRFPNFAIAFVAQQALGFFNAYHFAPRFEWDNQITKNHAFYLTTNVQAGYRASAPQGGLVSGYAYHSGFVQVGWGAKLVVADRLLLTFRPVNFRLAAPGLTVVDLEWDVVAGLGVLFGSRADD